MKRINKRRAKRWVFGTIIVLAFASSAFFSYIQDRGKLKVVFFDVGQGDSVLIRTPNGDDILIDGGPSSRVVQKLGEHLPFFDKDIELVVLTHPHADHLTGLIDVLERYNVKKVLMTDLENPTPFFNEWKKFLELENAEIELADVEDEFKFGDVQFNVLWPVETQYFASQENKDFSEFLNNNSIVLKLIYGNNKFLFTGDIACDTEKEIMDYLKDFNQDKGMQVLKVPHHGSKYSSCEEFLEILKPDVAVIEVGKNNYGLPSLRIIRRLERLAEKVFRTDEDGDAVFLCDEEGCDIKKP